MLKKLIKGENIRKLCKILKKLKSGENLQNGETCTLYG